MDREHIGTRVPSPGVGAHLKEKRNIFIFMRSKPFFSLAVVASSAALCFAANPAQALTAQVTVSGTTYDVTTFTGTYNANTSKFNTLINGGLMPWWGSKSLAEQFATAVGADLGTPLGGSFGPNFAYETQDVTFAIYVNGKAFAPANSNVYDYSFQTNETGTYATATLAPPPAAVPGPLPLLGVGAAFGMSRRLRRRIQLGG
jgi:hypothetical protein